VKFEKKNKLFIYKDNKYTEKLYIWLIISVGKWHCDCNTWATIIYCKIVTTIKNENINSDKLHEINNQTIISSFFAM